MPTLITRFNFGNSCDDNSDLGRQLNQIYSTLAQAINLRVSKNVTTSDPPDPVTPLDANLNYEIGDLWVNTSSNTAWIMTSRTTGLLVTWTQIT